MIILCFSRKKRNGQNHPLTDRRTLGERAISPTHLGFLLLLLLVEKDRALFLCFFAVEETPRRRSLKKKRLNGTFETTANLCSTAGPAKTNKTKKKKRKKQEETQKGREEKTHRLPRRMTEGERERCLSLSLSLSRQALAGQGGNGRGLPACPRRSCLPRLVLSLLRLSSSLQCCPQRPPLFSSSFLCLEFRKNLSQ